MFKQRYNIRTIKLISKKIGMLLGENKLFATIILIASILRLVGFYPSFPPYHSDEGMSYSSAIEMVKNFNFDPTRYDYPALIPIIHALIYGLILNPIFIPINLIFSPDNIPSFTSIADLWGRFLSVNQQTMVLGWARFITGCFGIGVVALVYLVSNKFFNDKRISLSAAFLTAVNFRQVLNSHLGLPDIYNAFFLLLGFYTFYRLLLTPSKKNYALSGLMIGLYFSIKFQIFILPPFIFIHLYHALQSSKSNLLLFLKNTINAKIILTVLIGFLTVILINYAHLIHWEEFRNVNSYTYLKYAFGVKQLNFYAISYLFYIGVGPFITIFSILGIIYASVKFPIKTFILLSTIIPFFYIFIYYSNAGFYTRNFVTITPLLLIFAGFFIVFFWDNIVRLVRPESKKVQISNLLILLTVVIISYHNLINSIISSINYTKSWNFVQARNWTKLNLPDYSKIVSHPWDQYPRDKNFEIIPLEPAEVFSISEMKEEGAEYGFINLDWLTLSSFWWMNSRINKISTFWNKPNDLLASTLGGVTAREAASYSIAAFVKPWQAPEMNILVIKIPQINHLAEFNLLKEFSFDKSDEVNFWHQVDDARQDSLYDNRVGKEKLGSIRLDETVGSLKFKRVVSDPIKINKNKLIKVEGWIKSMMPLEKKKRDGVIRVDFYENPGKIMPNTRSTYSSVSSRYFGSGEFLKKEIEVIPPSEAGYLIVSFELAGYSKFWFDDIKVYQSINDYEDPRKKLPYIDYKIPDNILFPYSQSGL